MARTALCTVAYFHPLANLLRRELRLEHEYQADRATLAVATVRDYRLQLLARQFTTRSSLLVAAFAQRPLKSRFAMMTQTFHPRQAWRLATAALLLAVIAAACTKEGVDEEQLAELDRVQVEGFSAEQQALSFEEAMATHGYSFNTYTIETFDLETGTSERQYVRYIVDRDGNPVNDFTVTEDDSKTRETRRMVRNQEVLKIVEEMPYFNGSGCAPRERACHDKAMLEYIYS